MEDRSILTEALAFHGHRCWASVAGVRAGLAALRALGVPRSGGTQLYAIVETGEEHGGMCFGDGVQYTTGCTFGKGNLSKNPLGKLAVTVIDKDSDRAVRVSYKPTLAKQIAASAFMQQRADGVQPDEIPEADQLELVELGGRPRSRRAHHRRRAPPSAQLAARGDGLPPCRSVARWWSLAYVRVDGDLKVCIPCSGYDR